ncbi:TIGR03032 family protein [Sphingomonas daechungensis]|uniref:TIGR03032 family protein n=1 Tax=Sphingomonas daechungensis TaxID=1176646 RepID=UPI0031E4EF99
MTDQVSPPVHAGASQTPGVPPEGVPQETKIGASRGLAAWLTRHKTSFAFTSYQSGRLLLTGTMPDGTISVNQQHFGRAMGVCWDRDGLWLATRAHLWRLENILKAGEIAEGRFDVSLMARTMYVTGDIDVHELSVDQTGNPVFVNTAYSCLAKLDPIHSFKPIWKPPFISELAHEDRCHMNGLGMLAGKPKYVTTVSQTDVADGWHGRPLPKGVLIDVEDDRIVSDRLLMPHSPRLADDGRVYAVDSGRGYVVEVNPQTGELRDIAFCPGFLRGMALLGQYALVTVSKPRYGTFQDIPIGDELARRNLTPICAVMVVDLDAGEIVEWLRLEGEVQELFAIELMPNIKCPMVVGPSTPEFLTTVTFDPEISSLNA